MKNVEVAELRFEDGRQRVKQAELKTGNADTVKEELKMAEGEEIRQLPGVTSRVCEVRLLTR